MLSVTTLHVPLTSGFLHLIDFIALFYLVLLLWIPFYWFVFHPAIRLLAASGQSRLLGGAAGVADFRGGHYHGAPRAAGGASWSVTR
jgi:hypothetical protein